jgi:transposase
LSCSNCEKLKLRIKELEKENLELKKKLAFYEGPHTPPSRETLKKKVDKKSRKKKRGAPKGHRGATRKRPEPRDTVDVPAETWPNCGDSPGDSIDTEERITEEIVAPPKIEAIKYTIYKYKCQNCSFEFTAKHEDCPQKGNFGVTLLTYITMLKYHLRGPYRKVQEFLAHCNDFEISPKGVMDAILRVGDACKREYDKTLERVRNAEWRYIDETGFKVNGEKWWLWIFRTNEDDVLTVIRKSRGRKVVDEILGKDHEGPDVVDGWKAYSHIKILQRGWAHLIREVDDYKDVSENGKRLSEEIHSMYDKLRFFLDKGPSMNERKRQKKPWDEEMEEIVERFSHIKELKKPVTYITNGLGNWHTCLLYPGMEPTNNLGEQAMREHVIMRKIIGCFRSENGSQNYQYIASLLASWKLQGKNMFVELENLLRRELCLGEWS